MDIRITDQLTRGQLRDLKKLYRSAFPASEKKPFWLIKMKKRAGITDILGLLDENNRLVGEIITIAWRDLLLVDYFAIAEQVRGQGCGTRALELLRERYNDRRILLGDRGNAGFLREFAAAYAPKAVLPFLRF